MIIALSASFTLKVTAAVYTENFTIWCGSTTKAEMYEDSTLTVSELVKCLPFVTRISELFQVAELDVMLSLAEGLEKLKFCRIIRTM
jgi:hypothetical protein